jgi:hypothetical protein
VATCLNCGRSGLFLSVNANRVCNICNIILITEIRQRARLIQESSEIVDKSKKLETRLSRCEFIVECAKALLPYEQKGIPTISPAPSELIDKFTMNQSQIIIDTLRQETEDAIERVKLTTSTKTKLSTLTKTLLRVRDYKDKSANLNPLSQLERQLLDFMHRIQLDAYLEAAEKAQMKGQKKKALDQYYEALYFLRHDEIDDSMQREQITNIETKIAEIDGKVIDVSFSSAALIAPDNDS